MGTEAAVTKPQGLSRRQFVALAGVVAGFAAFVLATKGKPLQGLLQTSQTSQTAQYTPTRARYVRPPATGSGSSLLAKLMGGKL